MKDMLKWTFAAAASATMLLMTPLASAQSGKVVWYNANGTKLGQAHINAFNKHYPDITVDMIVAGSGELLTRVKAEKGRPNADVLNSAVETLASDLNLFESYKTKEHNAFPELAIGPDLKYYGDSLSLQVFMVNTSMMPLDQAPKSWKDLADPKFRGKIVMANPALSGSSFSQIAQILQLHGWKTVEKVIENAVFVQTSRLVYVQVSRGEIPIAVTEESLVFIEREKGFPVEAIYPAEGTGMRYGAVAMLKGGPNPANAQLFVDFLNSLEGHNIGVEVRRRRSPRLDAMTPSLVGMPPTKDVKMFIYDDAAASAARDEILKRFDEVFSAKRRGR